MQGISVNRNHLKNCEVTFKFLWIFFLMLSNNKKDISRALVLKYISGFVSLLSFFKLFHFNYKKSSFRCWTKFTMLNEFYNFFFYLKKISFSRNFINYFYYSFEKVFNLFSIFFVPSFVFKKIDLLCVNNSCSYAYRSFSINNFFFYYKSRASKFFFYSFLFFKYFLDSRCFIKYFILLNVYFFLFNNLFYKEYTLFFIFKNQLIFATQWWENPKKFFVLVSSMSRKHDNSYNQKSAFFFWSSVSFLKYFNFPKHLKLSLNVKFVMIRHLRRVLILLSIDKLLFFFKTYVNSLNVLYFMANSPLNEIFVNPNDGSLVFDILVKVNSSTSFDQHMQKYKVYVQSLLGITVLVDFIKKWELLLANFKSCLKYVNVAKSIDLSEKLFLRYSFNCELLFFFKKKFLALKQKKAQSISKRRVKRIVKVAKRRFWIF